MPWENFTDPSPGPEFQTSYANQPNPYDYAGMLTSLFDTELRDSAARSDEDRARTWWLRYGGAYGPGFRNVAEAVGRGEDPGGGYWNSTVAAGIRGGGVDAPRLADVSVGPGILSEVNSTQEAQRLMPQSYEATIPHDKGSDYMSEMNRRYRERYGPQLADLNRRYPSAGFGMGSSNFDPMRNDSGQVRNRDFLQTVMNMLGNYSSRGRAW